MANRFHRRNPPAEQSKPNSRLRNHHECALEFCGQALRRNKHTRTGGSHSRFRQVIMDRGRPKIGNGSERINITIERDLLARADAIARQRKIGRSEMIASVLKLLISRKAS